ncbi:hypothetical protein ACFLY6_02380 [Candidatus Dependentiae bacterium]
MIKTKRHLWILFDSITNSVFESQVLEPILRNSTSKSHFKTTIFSFERNVAHARKKLLSLGLPENVSIELVPRMPFLGKPFLWPLALQLKKYLKKDIFKKITARGAIAGFIALIALKKIPNYTTKLIIQARGLAAEEYNFSNNPLWKKPIKWLIYRSLKSIEKCVYSQNGKFFLIESVSNALSEYLVKNFGAQEHKIYLAKDDIPPKIPKIQREKLKKEFRANLKIPKRSKVYCYSGSAKPWQCAKETIKYFAKQLKKNPKSTLMILSQDATEFEKLLQKFSISKKNCRLLNVKPAELCKFLCAADFGILLRKPHIINWVSRPTKALEYASAGLTIIHNGTINFVKSSPFFFS